MSMSRWGVYKEALRCSTSGRLEVDVVPGCVGLLMMRVVFAHLQRRRIHNSGW